MNTSTFLGLTKEAWLHIGRHLFWSALAGLVSFVLAKIIPVIHIADSAAFTIPVVTTALVSVKAFFSDQSQY